MHDFDKILNETLMFIAQKGWTKNEKAFYDSLSLFLAKNLNVTYVIIDKLLPIDNAVETLSFVANGEIKSNVTYQLTNTPCENVMGKNLCCYQSRIQELFPYDLMLVDMHAESYIGIPLWDTKGSAIGLIALLDTKPIENSKQIESILQIVAVRVAHEIERSNFENELIEKNTKLEESDRLKTAFLANVSHEIRTPMNAIMGFAELLKTDISDEKRTNFVEIIEKRCEDLLNIINDLLDISKIESNQLVLIESKVNVNRLIYEIVSGYLPILEKQKQNKVAFNLNVDNISDINILADPDRLKQIIINLLANAFKFTSEGNIELGYNIINNDSIKFYVKDTGIGIHPSKQKVIFERFRQADEMVTARKFGGTGLGLSISKGIIELMNGTIGVESEEGKGSIFFFEIPLKQIKTPNILTNNSESKKFDLNNRTILIVEDDVYNAEYLKELLINANCNLLFAVNGLEAVQIFKSNLQISLVLLDIKLPDMNGFDVFDEILKINPSIKIIAQTAFASTTDKAKCFDYGFCGYISKPIKVYDLLHTIQKVLE